MRVRRAVRVFSARADLGSPLSLRFEADPDYPDAGRELRSSRRRSPSELEAPRALRQTQTLVAQCSPSSLSMDKDKGAAGTSSGARQNLYKNKGKDQDVSNCIGSRSEGRSLN